MNQGSKTIDGQHKEFAIKETTGSVLELIMQLSQNTCVDQKNRLEIIFYPKF